MLKVIFFVLFYIVVVEAGCDPHPNCELPNFARCVHAEERCRSPYFRGPHGVLKPAIKREKDCRACAKKCNEMARDMSNYRNRKNRLLAASERCRYWHDIAEYYICIETQNGCFFHWEFPTEFKIAACRKCDRVCNHIAPHIDTIHDRRIRRALTCLSYVA